MTIPCLFGSISLLFGLISLLFRIIRDYLEGALMNLGLHNHVRNVHPRYIDVDETLISSNYAAEATHEENN